MGEITDFGKDLDRADDEIKSLSRDVAVLTGVVSGLREQLDARQQTVALLAGRMQEMQGEMKAIDGKLDGIRDQLAQARGGWRALMWLGGALGGLIASLAILKDHIRWQ
jgi:chromosome segregation ATPase